MKEVLKGIFPPMLWDFTLRMLNQKLDFVGDFASFADANAYAENYNQKVGYRGLGKNTLVAMMEDFKKQNQIMARDGNNNLIATILSAGMKKNPQNTLFLDVGGGGGNFYFLNKQKFLSLFPTYSYCVIEMPEIVEVGREFCADERLNFYTHIDEIASLESYDLKVLVLQGVLMYLEDAFSFLAELLQKVEFDVILLDRTAFSRDEKQHFKVQKVPKSLGCRALAWATFSRQEILNFFEKYNFGHFDEFNDPLDANTKDFVMRGMTFIQKDFFSNQF